MDSKETILIDCRNTKEFQIGHFPNAIDPNTTTFAQFPNWVQQNAGKLAHKKVLMYCTGGIRCEKASQYIRGQVDGVQSVQHLKGGIHKYLELYGSDGLWKGKNFVFDGRGATSGAETKSGMTRDEAVMTRFYTGEAGAGGGNDAVRTVAAHGPPPQARAAARSWLTSGRSCFFRLTIPLSEYSPRSSRG